MELLEILENLDRRIAGLLEENEILRLEAREAEQLRVKNQELQMALDSERASREDVEARITSMLLRLDEQLNEQPSGEVVPDQKLS